MYRKCNGNMGREGYCMSEKITMSPVFFQGGGLEFPSLSFEFPPPQTITNFVCFLDVLHIFSPHKSNSPPQNYISRKKNLLMSQDAHSDKQYADAQIRL